MSINEYKEKLYWIFHRDVNYQDGVECISKCRTKKEAIKRIEELIGMDIPSNEIVVIKGKWLEIIPCRVGLREDK